MSRHREALRETIERFKLVQAELSRKTEQLEKQGKGKKVATDSLNRYLKGKKDLYSEALETLENALDDVPRAFYFALLAARTKLGVRDEGREV